MIETAAAALVLAMLLGTVLLSQTSRTGLVRAAHGVAGGAGALLAIWAVANSTAPRPTFAIDGAALAGAALVLGITYWRFAGRIGGARFVVIALHGTAGAAGACLLAAFAFG
jgi:hypothetical protein